MLALVAVLVASCTSVSWSDGRGGRHHLGLIGYRQRAHAHGTELDVVSLGANLRLTGGARGYGVGVHALREVRPAERRYRDPRALAEAAARALRGELPEAGGPSVRRGVLYVHVPGEVAAVMTETRVVGLDLGPSAEGRRFALGYARERSLAGLEEGAVLLFLERRGVSAGAVLLRLGR